MKIEHMSARTIEAMIRKYIKDAAELARGVGFGSTNAYLDGIPSPAELPAAIEQLGEAYLAKLSAMAKAAPVVRGDTISIYEPRPPAEANAPSREDEQFLIACRKQLTERGFVLAADADVYEQIAKRYPDCVRPSRVRGAEARRWLELRDPGLVAQKAMKQLKRRR